MTKRITKQKLSICKSVTLWYFVADNK